MSKHVLYFPALVVAVVGGVTVAVGAVFPPVGFFVGPVTYVGAAAILVLFLRMLFDPRCHRGIEAANREMHGDQPFRAKWPRLRTHSQNSTVAARAMADRKTVGHRS